MYCSNHQEEDFKVFFLTKAKLSMNLQRLPVLETNLLFVDKTIACIPRIHLCNKKANILAKQDCITLVGHRSVRISCIKTIILSSLSLENFLHISNQDRDHENFSLITHQKTYTYFTIHSKEVF